ncbi:acyl-CoA thioesterase [Flexibacterium corallicola]|uniref:acyl-CoA thioesterase n=1 Tax=Flexibacterium corallicola TaxID=3037259 RepID=UPI00286F29B2|nr:acyl-CoA thioesterase II [Pseudovibrio sp. M1P-2-3]
MTTALEDFLELMKLEQLEENVFRAPPQKKNRLRLMGGPIIAQGLMAASLTVPEDRKIHSLHSYFVKAGKLGPPIDYHVERVRDGKSFSKRRLSAYQDDTILFTWTGSFQVLEEGLEHHDPMPDVPMPEELKTTEEIVQQFGKEIPMFLKLFWSPGRPIDMKPVDLEHYLTSHELPSFQNIWLKCRESLPEGPHLHNCLLALASDSTLLDTALYPHGLHAYDMPSMHAMSIDHAMWFHHPVKADEWILYSQDSPNASNGRGFCRGKFYSRDGTLIASTCQEGLIRQVDKNKI